MQTRRTTNTAGFWRSGILLLVLGGPMLLSLAEAQADHPWLDAQMKKQRYACPPGNSPVRGPAEAQVTIVEFADYDCPYCASDEPVIKQVLAAYPTQVRLVFKNLPLDIHSGAKSKAVLADCMGAQGKFWPAHDALITGTAPQKVRQGADQGKLNACISAGGDGQVGTDLALAKKLGMAETPGWVVDGIRIGGSLGLGQFKLLIDEELTRMSAAK